MSWSAQSLWSTISRLSYPPLFAILLAQYNPEPGTYCINLFNMGESTPSLVSPLAQAALPSPGPEIMTGSFKERNSKQHGVLRGTLEKVHQPQTQTLNGQRIKHKSF